MKEGWHLDDYLVLFSPTEADAASIRYAIARWLPNHRVIGLRSWDNLIVQDETGTVFSVPAVPVTADRVEPFSLPPSDATLTMDSRLSGKIKWYLQPLIFGGHPTDESNIHWIMLEQHADLVIFWNDRYREIMEARIVG
ncbi:MAG: hypothetical protein QM719_01240 [Thermomonas sp.]